MSQHRRRPVALVAAAAGALLLAACSTGSSVEVGPSTTPTTAPVPTATSSYGPAPADARLASFYSQKLVWIPCDGDFQCSTLSVPLSYEDPTA